MLAGLFGEDEDSGFQQQQQGTAGGSTGHGVPRPIPPRNRTRLCGLSNLGATCYMNALLQTLFYTPELREALFALNEVELGLSGENGQLRTIPVQLQSLFARLLLADQETVGVEGLISSFGWTNNEQLQQHDVQELNRILFDALESSLVGTSGERLIAQLYHGTSVQQVTCSKCSNISEREEDFLDIPVALSGKAGLEAALKEMYCDMELLEGSNQYRCERCASLVDAKRGCSLRKLPPILTFNLLRFLYDFDKGERYKDLSHFQFPRSLNMKPYLDMTKPAAATDRDQIYDLFSVLIHSGSTHSGHYIAYIRDIDDLGVWNQPENEPVSMKGSDVLEYNSPLELLQAIVDQFGGKLTINKICKQLQEQTGVTWNKRFKQQYGPITKFIKQNDHVFEVDSSNNISIKKETLPTSTADIKETTPTSLEGSTPKKNDNAVEEMESTASESTSPVGSSFANESLSETAATGQNWFEFNDSQVSCIHSSSIDKMFSGRQSAYMLFYRLRSLTHSTCTGDSEGDRIHDVPQWLQEEVATANTVLDADRQHYDITVNTVALTIHLFAYYVFANGALQNIMEGLVHKVKIDRRKTIGELQAIIIEEVGEASIMPNGMTIHLAKELPAGLHLYECVSIDADATLMDRNIINDCHLFVWNSITINNEVIPVGKDSEPILLHLNYPGPDGSMAEISSGFSKCTTVLELRHYLSHILTCDSADISLNRVQRSVRSGDVSIHLIPNSKDSSTLMDLSLDNGDHITAEHKTKKGYRSFAHSIADKQNKMITFIVENRCVMPNNDEYSVNTVEVSKTEQLHQVKVHILSILGLSDVQGGGRLRIDDDFEGIGPSLCEEQSVTDAGIESGVRVILEPGYAPSVNQISLKCSFASEKVDFHEVIVNRSCSVKECCSIMVATLGLMGEDWHLRKANWSGEAGEIVDDENATVEQLKFKSGECFLVESGRLPPKGFVRLSIYLYTLDSLQDVDTPLSVMDWFNGVPCVKMLGTKREAEETQTFEEMEVTELPASDTIPLHEQNPVQYYPKVRGSLTFIGDIEISKEATVQDLKEQILTLPELLSSDIPSPDFLRVRDLCNNRPLRIFKEKTHSLKRLKLTSGTTLCCQILPNEEALSATSIAFNMYLRHVQGRSYSYPIEVVYDTAESTTPTGLRNHISHLLATPPESLVIAKHKFESFQWIRIEGHEIGDDRGKKGKRKVRRGGGVAKGGAKGGGAHVNIKNAPILLRDGDDIGIKNLQFDPEDKDDFSTSDDEKGRAILDAIQEEKRRRRKVKSENNDLLLGGSDSSRKKKQRCPEIGIKIFVPDFSSTSVAMAADIVSTSNDVSL